MLRGRSVSALRRFLALTIVSAAGGAAWGQAVFTECASATGLAMTHAWPPNYMAGLAFMLAGGAVGDFNNDGWQDVYVVSGGTVPDMLFINNGDGTFTDRALEWGLSAVHMGASAAVGDYNNDGWLDVYVPSYGDSAFPMTNGVHKLYRNNGNGTFTDVAVAAGVHWTDIVPNAFSAAFGDYDLDGDLDLYVTAWFDNSAGGNRLFRNNGDETFTDVTVEAGLLDYYLHGFAPRFVDMDGDLYPELTVAGDFDTSRYYVNNRDGTFTEISSTNGTGLDCNGMGSTIGDFNNDGLFDWYVTNIYIGHSDPNNPCGNRLYMNQGGHQFIEVAESAGVNQGFWGWGTVAVDLDHDTWQDLVEVNGFSDDPFKQQWANRPARMWVNNGDMTFTEVSAQCNFTHIGQGRGLINFDYDNDGDQDLLVFSAGEPLEFYRNDGPTGNWLRLFFDTSQVEGLAPDGFGTKVRIRLGQQHYYRYMDGGCNYLSQSELTAHFGLGEATVVDEIKAYWGNGTVTTLGNVAANQTLTLRPPRIGPGGPGSPQSPKSISPLP